MKKKFLTFLLCLVPATAVLSQNNVGIGTTTPNTSALLDISSTNKGLLVPRMTALQRLAVNPSASARALLVFDTDSSGFFFWTGAVWSKLLSSGSTYQWLTNGNNIYNNNSGNVGIGNSNPQYKLDVSGRIQLRGSIDYNNSAGLWLGGAGADSAVRKIFIGMRADSSAGFYSGSSDVGWGLVFDGRIGTVGIGNPDPSFPISFKDRSGDKISLYREGSNYYGLGVGNASMQLMTPHSTSDILFGYGRSAAFTENMRIKGNGNVGIGTASPPNKLSVSGNADFTGSVGIGITAPFNKLSVNGNTNITGNLGIGIVVPGFPLNFNSIVGDKISLFGSTGPHYGFGIQAGVLQIHSSSSADDIALGYGSSSSFTERMRIKGNGDIGLGVSDPAFVLDVGGRMRIRATPGFTAGLWLNDEANTASNVFIGMQADNLIGFFGAGVGWLFNVHTNTGNANLSGSLTQNSDMRLKKNIEPISNVLAGISQLSGYRYNWKDENADPAVQIGFLAQELQKVFPELVKQNDKGTLSVNYIGMVPVLLQAIKEQQQDIDELKKLVKQLINK